MSNDYTAKPINAPLISRPGESAEYTGTRNVQELLPNILQTFMNKKFFDSTVEQLMSSGSLQVINNYIGRTAGVKNPEDNYIVDNRFSDNYQFVPSLVNRDNDKNITDAITYDDLVESLKFNGVDVNNHNRLYNELGYTLGLPINYDMFINYHKYFWALNDIPICDITPVQTGTIDIDEIVTKANYTTPVLSNGKTLRLGNGMLIRFSPSETQTYIQGDDTVTGTTTFAIGGTSPTDVKVYLGESIDGDSITELKTAGVDYNIVGTNVVFVTAPADDSQIIIQSSWASSSSGDYGTGAVYIVDNVGQPDGIVLTEQYAEPITPYYSFGQSYGEQNWFTNTLYSESIGTIFETPTGYDSIGFDRRYSYLNDRDYVVEQRFSKDRSPWTRSNLWIKEEVINDICVYNDLDVKEYTDELSRAVRPIIEMKANIEKYDFGTNHIKTVTHLIEKINPAADIIGSTNFNLAEFIATTEWTERGYNNGDKVYYEIGGNRSYWQCIKSHSDAIIPNHYSNRDFWKPIISKNIENNDIILFLDSGSTYSNNIYRAVVDDSGTVTALTEIFGSGSTALQTGDCVSVIIGYNDILGETGAERNNIWSGSDWYWNGTEWVYAQQKEHKGKGILFQLYDIDGNSLTDTTLYPNTTFKGDPIFDYQKSDTAQYDLALGFKPKPVDYGHNQGFEFVIGCSNIRYQYNVVNPNATQVDTDALNILEVKGFYYYKSIDTDLFFNNWKAVDQPVKRAFQHIFEDAQDGYALNIGTNDINVDNKFDVVKRGDGLDFFSSSTANSVTDLKRIGGLNPLLYLKRGKTYTFNTHFDESEIEFTDSTGNTIAGIVRSAAVNDVFTLTINGSVTDSVIKYTKTSGTPSTGYIFLNDNEPDYTITATVRNSSGKTTIDENLFTISNNVLTIDYEFSENDVLDVEWHTDSPLTANADGYWLPADTHILNPQNERIVNVTYGDMQDHIKSQMESIPGFSGNYFGDNNYTRIPNANTFGGTIRQQAFSTELISQTSSSNDTNPFNSLNYNAQQYRRFISQFKSKVKQLHKTMDITVPVYEVVDEALKQINLGKNRNSPFAKSDMAYYEDYESIDVRWSSGDSQTFNLPRSINDFNDASNHIQVWLKDVDDDGRTRWRVLQKNIDYVLSRYSVTIIAPITYDANEAFAHIRWYPQNSVSFIPPSAAKLGLIKPFQLQLLSILYMDLGYLENQEDYIGNLGDVTTGIVLHDGSIHIRSGTELYDRSKDGFSIVDAAIWDLENRIVNNLNEELVNITDYKEIMPSEVRQTRDTWEDLTAALEPDFIQWKVRNNIERLNDENYYVAGDRFTWNYSSVGPGIGGYAGLYTYYFNTDRPHTHPWEMFGYNSRPTWWDANYSWDDPTKRSALVAALRVGHYNDPAETPKYNIAYAYSHYDWIANELVTDTNDLNDPITANVVTTPTSVEASKDFVFGDWGPVEAVWRSTSEYKFSLISALMKLRPLWVTNTYFNSINRRTLDGTGYDTVQYYFDDTKELGNNRTPNFTYTPYEDNIIEYIQVVNGGTGYVSAPDLTVYSNFGSEASVVAHVENESVVAVHVAQTGENYQSKPTISIEVFDNSIPAVLDPYMGSDAVKYYAGFSNSIVEYSRFNNIKINELDTRFLNMEYNPIIKASGFVKRNNQEYILESSQDKGKVRIPQENANTLLYIGKPKDEKFFGSVKITKTATGFSVNGFDNSDQMFKYYPVNQNANSVAVSIENRQVIRYTAFSDKVSTLAYGTVFDNVQDVYSFVIGYQHYLEQLGWSINSWVATANDFARWAYDSNTSVGDQIFIKPDTSRIYIREPENGYFDNVSTRYNGNYNLIDSNGKQISSSKVLISRNVDTGDDVRYTIVERKDNETVIHGLRLYTVDIEHIVVFDNSTEFDDVIYNPALGQVQKRIIWRGSRTKDWNGKLYAPGYVVNDNTIVNNFDSTARELDQYYGPSQTLSNQQIVDVARANAGYNKPVWAENLLLDDDTTWNFIKGTYKYKGTQNVLSALQRTTSLFGSVSDINFYEEWAIRTADYGDTRTNDVLEFQFKRELITTNPQPVRFTDGVRTDILSDITIDVDSVSDLLVTGNPGGNFQTRPHTNYNKNEELTFSQIEVFDNDFPNAGLPLTTETDYRVLNSDLFVDFLDNVSQESIQGTTPFNIWVAQDNARGGYNVFQVFDFGSDTSGGDTGGDGGGGAGGIGTDTYDFVIKRACAGITEVDDAEITLDGINHNLEAGDYVLILGSNTTPSIDGIHQVSAVDPTNLNQFFIDEFIEREGTTGRIYPIRSVRFDSYSDLLTEFNQQVNGIYKYDFTRLRQGITDQWTYVFVDSDDTGVPAVYRFNGSFDTTDGNVGSWVKHRQSTVQARNDLIDNVKIFDAQNQTVIDIFEVYDPFKGIIPGFIQKEIDYIQTNDIAVYNFDTLNGQNTAAENKKWQETFVGTRWWDLKNALYLNYEQGSIDYKQSNWGALFDGASIDIYEWTKSPVLPEQWEEFVGRGGVVDGRVASGEAYYNTVDGERVYYWSEAPYYNVSKKRTETVYYFWVKRKQTTTPGRIYNVSQLETILTNPTAADVRWFAAMGESEILIANGYDSSTRNSVVQINQKYPDSEALTNSEYTIIGEDNPNNYIPEYLHIKMRDSLVGYNKYTETTDFTVYDSGTTYSEGDVVRESGNYYISRSNGNVGNSPSADTTQTYWRRLYDFTLPEETLGDDIQILKPKLVPDIRLHPFNRYGHLERPIQSLNRNINEARQNIIQTINSLFAEKIFVNEFSNIENILGVSFTEGAVTYDLSKYWTYTDYIRTVYDSDGSISYQFDKSLVPQFTVDYWEDIENSNSYEEGSLVLVRFVNHFDNINRPVIVRRINNEWVTEWKKFGTIAFTEELWNQEKFGHGFDNVSFGNSIFDSNMSNIIQKLLDVLREDVFINQNKHYYSRLWFSWLQHAVTENTTSEFAFKTTYGTLNVQHPLLLDQPKYQTYSTQPIEDFFDDVKPFHTKVRQVIDSPTHLENSGIEITETFLIYIDDNPASLELHLDAFDAASIPSGVDDTIWEDISGV